MAIQRKWRCPCYLVCAIDSGWGGMHRTNSLTLAAVVLVVAYAVFLRTIEEPRAPPAAAAVAGAQPSTEMEPPIQPTPVVVSVPARPDRSSKFYAQSQPAALIPDDSVMLIREIQRELRRVGCYEREINGMWTTSSRMATQMFTERVNARLPIDTPDAALLGLLQSQPQPICGKSCAPAQSNDGASGCVPGAPEAGTSPSARAPAVSDKLKTQATAPQPPPASDRRSADGEAPTTQRIVRPASKNAARYWRSLVRSVDRALGLY
jgi:hypothetical protein